MTSPTQQPARSSQLSEDMFAPALERKAHTLFDAITVISSCCKTSYEERSLYAVYHEAGLLEDYLDLHGAASNKRFHLIREDVSGIKWIAQALSCLSLLKDGPNPYPSADTDWSEQQLTNHVATSISRLNAYLDALFSQLSASWLEADLAIVSPKATEAEIHPPLPTLPSNLLGGEDEDSIGGDNSIASRYLSRFMRLFNSWDVAATTGLSDGSSAGVFMKKYCTEAIARSFQSRVHNLQSDYDSHLRNTPHELGIPQLRKVRGAVSECLHLLEAVTALTHLYERHHRHPHLSKVLPWPELVDVLANHLILSAYKSLGSCMPLAQELLNGLTVSSSTEVLLPDGIEMHARPLSMIANVVKHHGLDVEIECAGRRANAASFMAMLVLVGSHPGTRTYYFHGDRAALADIEQLFALGLGEKGLGAVTEAFPFLK
jgi:phosphotransferase system HPr-like phosphotransfer protein